VCLAPEMDYPGYTRYSGRKTYPSERLQCLRKEQGVLDLEQCGNQGVSMFDFGRMNDYAEIGPELLSGEELELNDDVLAEEILNNITGTPIGQLLKEIASLPEMRKEKIYNIRRQLNRGQYDVNGLLDIALDKVLEELVS